MSKIIEVIQNAAESFKNFIIDNGSNPILWIVLFFAGILLFFFTFNALNKHK